MLYDPSHVDRVLREFGTLVLRERINRSMSREEFGDLAGKLSRNTICNIEQGHTKPSLDTFLKIAGALGRTAEDIFQEIDP